MNQWHYFPEAETYPDRHADKETFAGEPFSTENMMLLREGNLKDKRGTQLVQNIGVSVTSTSRGVCRDAHAWRGGYVAEWEIKCHVVEMSVFKEMAVPE